MNKRAELLNLKIRLISLSLMGACFFGFSSCGYSDSFNNGNNDSKNINSTEDVTKTIMPAKESSSDGLSCGPDFPTLYIRSEDYINKR